MGGIPPNFIYKHRQVNEMKKRSEIELNLLTKRELVSIIQGMKNKIIEYEIDNRDSRTTWLQTEFGYIELSLQDMFDLIENVIENMEA